MSNPLVKRDLLDAILELRAEVETRLKQNKYYVALHKLDELLEAIRPLDVIDAAATEDADAAETEAEAEVAAEAEAAQPASGNGAEEAIPAPPLTGTTPERPRFYPAE